MTDEGLQSRFSIPGFGIDESVIPVFRRNYRLAEICKRTRKNVGFHCRATTSVHLANENNLIENKVHLCILTMVEALVTVGACGVLSIITAQRYA